MSTKTGISYSCVECYEHGEKCAEFVPVPTTWVCTIFAVNSSRADGLTVVGGNGCMSLRARRGSALDRRPRTASQGRMSGEWMHQVSRGKIFLSPGKEGCRALQSQRDHPVVAKSLCTCGQRWLAHSGYIFVYLVRAATHIINHKPSLSSSLNATSTFVPDQRR